MAEVGWAWQARVSASVRERIPGSGWIPLHSRLLIKVKVSAQILKPQQSRGWCQPVTPKEAVPSSLLLPFPHGTPQAGAALAGVGRCGRRAVLQVLNLRSGSRHWAGYSLPPPPFFNRCSN